MSTANYWDGDQPLRPGLIVKYIGTQDSEIYSPPPPGTLITLIAEDCQMEHTKVWICRWYDEEKRIQLCPLLPVTFKRAEEPVDIRVQQVAVSYTQQTGQNLNPRALEKALDFLLNKHEDVGEAKRSEPLYDIVKMEVTLLVDGSFGPLTKVPFPVTVLLHAGEYNVNSQGIAIRGDILNLLPGADKDCTFNDTDFYLFYSHEAKYKETT